MSTLSPLLDTVVGAKGDIRNVSFWERDRRFNCYVPDDSLWGAVKDNLILREYERDGISLDQVEGTVIDAGAHVGLFSIRISAYASRVIALEPHPVSRLLLQVNLSRNRVTSVEILGKALWASAQEMSLFEGNHSGSASVVERGEKYFRVRSETLDDVVSAAGPVDLLKLDIEGAEFPVLEGTSDESLREISTIVGEMHVRGKEQGVRRLIERLRGLDFNVSIKEPPLYFWQDSVSRVVRNWSKLEKCTRLKLAVLSTYTAVAVLDAFVDTRSYLNPDNLRFLYATRSRS